MHFCHKVFTLIDHFKVNQFLWVLWDSTKIRPQENDIEQSIPTFPASLLKPTKVVQWELYYRGKNICYPGTLDMEGIFLRKKLKHVS